MVVGDHAAGAARDTAEIVRQSTDHQVADQEEVGGARTDLGRAYVVCIGGELDVADHRTPLLRQAGHVHDAHGLSVQMCRHADDRADRHDAGSAYARYHQRTFRSEEHTSELQSIMRNSYAVFCLKKKKNTT